MHFDSRKFHIVVIEKLPSNIADIFFPFVSMSGPESVY